MKYLTVDSYQVKPCQSVVRLEHLKEVLNNLQINGYYPIPVINFGLFFLMGDGHHTGSLLMKLDEPINIMVLENDIDVRNNKKGIFCKYQTFNEAINGLSSLSLDAEERGVNCIGDMLAYDGCCDRCINRVSELDLDELMETEGWVY